MSISSVSMCQAPARQRANQNTPEIVTPTRPDPAHGLFETLLVVAGEPIELDAHLDRLAASLLELCGERPPGGLGDAVRERAAGTKLGRLRITVTRSGTGPRAALAAEDVDPADFFPARGRGARLRSLRCDGGLGAHKLADRRSLGAAGEGVVPLLFDRGEEALEAGRANLFAVFGETLATPIVDGRILPGIARAGAIAAARQEGIEVSERRLRRDELFAADEVFLTGSVRGVEPARSLDGVPLAAGSGLSRRVGERLRRRWLIASGAAAAPGPATVPPLGQLAR